MSDTEVESIPPNAASLRADQFSAQVMAPKRAWVAELRERIKAEQIVDRFNACALGELRDDPMTRDEITAGAHLLNRVLPTLQAVAVADSGGGFIIERVFFAKNSNP